MILSAVPFSFLDFFFLLLFENYFFFHLLNHRNVIDDSFEPLLERVVVMPFKKHLVSDTYYSCCLMFLSTSAFITNEQRYLYSELLLCHPLVLNTESLLPFSLTCHVMCGCPHFC